MGRDIAFGMGRPWGRDTAFPRRRDREIRNGVRHGVGEGRRDTAFPRRRGLGAEEYAGGDATGAPGHRKKDANAEALSWGVGLPVG